MDIAAMESISNLTTGKITRHFNKNITSITLRGSYRFGTIEGYRPADCAQVGRFSDHQEGIQREIFHSRSGIFNAKIGSATFENVSIDGFENPIAVEYEVNDYCSCSSVGDFSHDRAIMLRERGNPDIDYYSVYDLPKLIEAISEILKEKEDTAHLSVICRAVSYGEKDRHWQVEDRYDHTEQRDHLAVWLGNAFVKSPDYSHEAEIRMLIIDPSKPGQLASGSTYITLNDQRIADAIVDHGSF
ncbi:hypothetical protein [Paracoccus yeei]|uniref:hypothetical protein n=1 Tax=Paracoccus yeei TaxID=147645 RepID=UPI001C8D2D3E|nr:hypothetical protein [Paracoccus yeei]